MYVANFRKKQKILESSHTKKKVHCNLYTSKYKFYGLWKSYLFINKSNLIYFFSYLRPPACYNILNFNDIAEI